MKSNTLKLGLLATSALAALTLLVGCGDDGGNGGSGPSGNEAITNKTITGVSQKGPFVNGASVTVQELDGKTLAQTGKSFKGKISNDKGEFSVPNVTLSSKYALLEANGYYWNENTRRQSAGPITLNALADLSKRDNVNINLLTHLEYERALYLISTSKGVADAKKQAEGEIFKAFGVTGDFANSEELDILAKGEGDAALLAISVLMLGNLTEAQLSGRLADFAIDIAQDGTWDDEAMKTTIADWASSADLNAIRANVELLEPGSKAPAFEPIVKAFWWNNYGLGECSSKNQGEVRKNGNEQSWWRDTRYVCDNGDWRRATVLEYDLYGWNPGADGEIKKGNVSDASYKYDSLQGQWSAANDRDLSLGLNGCTQNREGEVDKGSDYSYYICRGSQWQDANTFEYDTYGWGAGRDGEIKKGNVSDRFYKYVAQLGRWRVATALECDLYEWIAGRDGEIKKGNVSNTFYKYDSLRSEWAAANERDTTLKLNGCTQKRATEVAKGIDGKYYICRDDQWQNATVLEYDTYKKTCLHNSELVTGAVIDTNLYVCDADTFRAVTFWEKMSNRGCTEHNLNEERLFAGYMQCSSSGKWTLTTVVPGMVMDERDGMEYKTTSIGTQTWMAENLNYDYKVNGESFGSGCLYDSVEYCAKYGREYTWAAAMDTAVTGCGDGKTCNALGKIRGICPAGWHLPDLEEWNTLLIMINGNTQRLKAVDAWHNINNDCYASDDIYGFSALPTGDLGYDEYTRFWTSSENDQTRTFLAWLHCGEEASPTYLYPPSIWDIGVDILENGYGYKSRTSFVRCVKD